MKRLTLNVNGAMRYASRELVESIVADFKARGVTTAQVYSVEMYGVEVSDAEWEAAKAANTARREAKRKAMGRQ